VEEVRRTVYDRMISERNRIADKFRSEGQGESSRINGEKERELLRIQSEAFREAETIRGKADAEAAAIYNSAYNRSSSARELYDFAKSMEAYASTIDKETSLIISTDSEFYKYLNSIDQ
jgi:membrane protease subunit HflC